MKLPKAPTMWLLALLVLDLSGCAERLSQPRLERVLAASWQSYRQQFISPEGRVLLPERDGGTISEAQAYALLRAVWAGDETTFALVYGWTVSNLGRLDHLLAWHWGRRPDGSWGVLDANTASDGDLDYALALILAARRGWRAPPDSPDYRVKAKEVLAAILEKEAAALPGGEVLLLTPGNWHEAGPPYLINPSYFSPAAYRLFSQISLSRLEGEGRGGGEVAGVGPVGAVLEPSLQNLPIPQASTRQDRGDLFSGAVWNRLHRDTYQLLEVMNQGLGESPGVGLFPDWCRVDAQGRLSPAPGRDTHFGWEAVRLPWRVALDSLWFGEARAGEILGQKFLPFFKKEWQARGKLAAVYSFEGVPLVDYDSPVLYAGVLAAALAAGDRDFAGQLAQKILSFYHEKDGRVYFVSPDNYYANNWAWLGLALYAGRVKP